MNVQLKIVVFIKEQLKIVVFMGGGGTPKINKLALDIDFNISH